MQIILKTYNIKSLDKFRSKIKSIADKNLNFRYHCFIQGDYFKISTGAKIYEFNFKAIKNSKTVCDNIAFAIETLKQHRPTDKIYTDSSLEAITLLR